MTSNNGGIRVAVLCGSEEGECINSNVESRLQGLGENLLGHIQTNLCPQMTLEAIGTCRIVVVD